MVAIVSGNGLGLELGSWATLGGRGAWGTAEQGASGEQVYVNATTGNVVVRRQDDFVAGAGVGLGAVRTYNSQGLLSDDNADNWSMGIFAQQLKLLGSLNTAGSSVIRTGRDGSQAAYVWDDERGLYLATGGSGAHDTITYSAATQQYTRADGSDRTLERYAAASGRLLSVTDASGNTVGFSYDSNSGLLTKVMDGRGNTTTYAYNEKKQLTALATEYKHTTYDAVGDKSKGETASRTLVAYDYDTEGRLSAVRIDLTPDNQVDDLAAATKEELDRKVAEGKVYRTTYTYDGSSTRVKTLSQADGSMLTFGYTKVGTAWRLASVCDALGATTRYSYDTEARRTTVTDAMAKTWVYAHDEAGQLISVTLPAVTGSTATQSFAYDADGNLIRMTNGEGEWVAMAYDANGNQVLQRDHLGNTVARTFTAANQLLTETRSTLPPADVINQSGIKFVGSDIVKASGRDGGWDASFRSVEGFTGGAAVSFKPAQSDKALMVGLNADPGADHSWGSLDFALHCTASGELEVRESGSVNKLNSAQTYKAGDTLQVDFDGMQVRYLKNNAVIYAHSASVTQPLFADSSFAGLGAKIGSLSLCSSPSAPIPSPLVVANKVTLSAGGKATKNDGQIASWDASVRSLAGFAGGANVSFKATQTDKSFMVGLTADPTAGDSHTSIDYAMYCESGGGLYAFESGTRIYFADADTPTTYAVGDTLKVTYDGTNVKYLQNNKVLREVSVTISQPLYLDSSFCSVGAGLDALQFGRQALTTVVSLSPESNISLAGNSATKTGGSNTWDAAVRSAEAYSGTAGLSFSAATTDKALMIGLTTDPETKYDWTSLDWAIYLTNDGRVQIREGGSITNALSSSPLYKVGDRFQITYNGQVIRYLQNGQLLRAVEVDISAPLYLDSSFQGIGAKVTDLRFGDDPNSDLTTRHVYSAAKPTQLRYTMSPEGRVTEYRYDDTAKGQRTAEIMYAATLYSVATLAVDQVPSEQAMDVWRNGLTGLQATAARREFNYDARGLLASEIKFPSASGSVSDSMALATLYFYDAAGRLVTRVDPQGDVGDLKGRPTTSYAYDGLGRVVSTASPLGSSTTTTYDDANRRITLTQPSDGSSATTVSVSDAAGRLISVARSGGAAISYAYDAAGRLLMTTDPTGLRKFSIYDERGRRAGDVDGDGTLTEYTFDKADRQIRQYTYLTPVPTSELYDFSLQKPRTRLLSEVRPVSNALDMQSWKVWDDAGRLVYEIGDQGELTQFDYDGNHRLVQSTRYAEDIVATTTPTVAYVKSQLASTALLAAGQDNRVTRHAYDADGREVASLDPEGYLVRNTYDGTGRLVQTRRYATAVDVELRSTGALETLAPTASDDDQVEVFFYDGRNQLVGQVDAAGFLTQSSYNARGLLREQTRYNTALANPPHWTHSLEDVVTSIRPDSVRRDDDRTTSYRYTLNNQLLSTTNHEGTRTVFTYDGEGRLSRTSAADGLAEARSSHTRYDAWGRKTAELSAENAARLPTDTSSASYEADESGVWDTYSVRYTYDQADRLASRTDANGHKKVFYYDRDGRLTHTVNALGEVEETQYNTLGQHTASIQYGARIAVDGLKGGLVDNTLADRLAKIANAVMNKVVRYSYNAAGLCERVTRDIGGADSILYNSFGEVRSRSVSGGPGQPSRLETLGYDRRGALKTESHGTGQAVVTRQTDAFGRITRLTDANGQTTQSKYDKLGRVQSTTNALGANRSTKYDAFGQVLSTTDELGRITGYKFNSANRSVTMTTAEGVTVTTVHDRHGQAISVTDGNGVATTHTYTREGRLKESRVGTVLTESRKYDSGGRLEATTDSRGVETRYTYDAANRTLTRVVDPSNSRDTNTQLALKTSWTYDARGRAVSVRDARSILTTYTFFSDGSLEQVVDAPEPSVNGSLALKTRWTYDDQGRVLSELSPGGTLTAYSYDALGRRSQERVDPDGLDLTTRFAYDDHGNLVATTDPAGGVARYTYDAAQRRVYTIDPAGGASRTEYDKAGRVVRTTRCATAIKLTGLPVQATSEQISKLIQPSSKDQVQTQWYDKDGRLRWSVNALGAVTGFTCDGNGNITRRVDHATAIKLDDWDDISLAPPVVKSNNDRVQRLAYDTFNRLTDSLDSLGGLTRMAYDSAGNITRRTEFAKVFAVDVDPTALADTAAELDAAHDRVTAMYYDTAGRLAWTTDAMGGVTRNEYDSNGNITRVTAYEKTVKVGEDPRKVIDLLSTEARVTRMTYDRANRRLFVVDALGFAQLDSYDANGRVVTRTRYTALSNVTGTGAGPYSVSVDATPAADLATQYTYDAAGRKLSETIAAGQSSSNTRTFVYNALGLLVTDTDPRGNALAYSDSEWARSERTRLGYPGQASGLTSSQESALLERYATHHTYDTAGRRTSTTNALNQVTRSTYDGLGNAVKVVDPRGNAGYFYFDALGRVTLQVDAEGYANEIAYSNTFSQQIASVWRRYTKLPTSINETARPAVVTHSKDARLQFNQYDKLDRLTRSEDSLGAFESTTYGTSTNRFGKSVTNKLGGTATYTFDRMGRQLSETLPVEVTNQNNELVAVVNTYSYNTFGDRTGSMEALGLAEQRTTEYRVDKMGRVTHRIGMAFTALDAATLSTSTVVPLEYTVYDGLGRIIEQRSGATWSGTAPVGGMRTLSWYDAAGFKTAQVGPDGTQTRWRFDAAGDVFKETVQAVRNAALPPSPGGSVPTVTASPADDRTTTSIRDALGRVIETRRDAVIHWEQPNNSNEIVMDLPGYQPETITLGRTLFDANGNVVQQIDARGNSIHSYYDKIGRKLLQIDQDGYATAWDYDDVFDVATRETRYSSRLPAYARQDNTAAAAALRDPAALRTGLDDGSDRPIDGARGVRLNHTPGTNSAMRRSLGSFSAGDTVTFTAWFKADLQTTGMIFIGEKGASGGWATSRYTTGYGDGDWQQLSAQITLTRDAEVVVYLYGDRDGAFHKAGGFAYYDRAQAQSAQRGNVLNDSFESGTFEGWTPDGSTPISELLSIPVNRVTEFSLDRQGRVLTQAVKAVHFQSVENDEIGTVTSSNTDALTTYTYNGLGLTTQIRQRASRDEKLVFTDQLTDIRYDLMGRETERREPGYADQDGALVRPTKALEYNGLGSIAREIQRGKISGADTDDRITSYEYSSNGDRIQQTDALGQLTIFELDAAGRVARRTLKGVSDADGKSRDLFTLYRYGGASRVSVTTDVGTGEVRRTAYNAFGEISHKGFGDSGWQEFFLYNTLGKVQKSNAEGGATRIYLHDRNGNVTRQIEGGEVDLTNASITESAASTKLQHTFSSYNKRNLLQRTVEPDIEFQRSVLEMQGAFSQELAPLYPDMDVGNSAGGAYTEGSVNAQSHGYTTVGGVDDPKKLAPAEPSLPPGIRTYGAFLPSSAAIKTETLAFGANWRGSATEPSCLDSNGDNPTRLLPSSRKFVIPSNWPSGVYRLRNLASPTPISSIEFRGGTSSFSVPVVLSAVPEGGYFSQDQLFVVEYQMGGGDWLPAYSLRTGCTEYLDNYSITWSGGDGRQVYLDTKPQIAGGSTATSVYACINPGTLQEQSLPCSPAKDSSGRAIAGYWTLDTSNLPEGIQKVTVRCMDSKGNLLKGSTLTVSSNYFSGCTSSAATLVNSDAWVSQGYRGLQRGIHFSPAKLGGTGSGKIWFRPVDKDGNSAANWSPPRSVTGWGADLGGCTPGVRYEFILNTQGDEYRGIFTPNSNGIPMLENGGMLQKVGRTTPLMRFNLTDSLRKQGSGSYEMKLTILRDSDSFKQELTQQFKCTATGGNTSTAVSFDLSQIHADLWTNSNYTYSYVVHSHRPDSIKQFVGQGQGRLRLGSDPRYEPNSSSSTGYLPQAILTLPPDFSLSNPVTVRLKSYPAGGVTMAAGDWRRVTLSNTRVGLDLSQWLSWNAADPKVIEVIYKGSDADFTAEYTLFNDGRVKLVSMSCDSRQPMIPLTIAGATRLSVLKVGAPKADESAMSSVNLAARVTTRSSTFTWNADDQPRNTARRFYYEAVDASGKLIGKGYGNFTLAQDNSLSHTMEDALIKPTVLTFSPEASTPVTVFELQLRPKDSTGPYTRYSSTGATPAIKPDGFGGYTFDATSLRPKTDSDTFECVYTAKDAEGKVQSSGRGTVTVLSSGASSSELEEDRKPTLVTLYSPPGRNIPKLRLEYRSVTAAAGLAYSAVLLTGTYDEKLMKSMYVWDASKLTPEAGFNQFDFVVRYQEADGAAYTNEMDDPIVIEGRMTLGATQSSEVKLERRVTSMKVDAQVRHMQVYNAFGQISEEYDDGTYERMKDMVSRYGGTMDPDAVRTTFLYNTLGLLTYKTDPQTHVTEDNGYRWRTRPITRYGYDLAGRLTTITDANGNVSKQSFAGAGDDRLAWQWAGDGGLKKNAYDALGQLSKFTDEIGAVTRYTTDLLGRRTKAERLGINAQGIKRVENFTGAAADAGGAAAVATTLVDTYTYDMLGQRISHTNTLGWTDKTFYDSLGRVTKTVSAAGAVTSYTYVFKEAGLATGGIKGAGGKSTGGWLLTTTQADGRTLQDATDYFGLTTWHKDLAGRSYTYTYDINGRLKSQTSSGGPTGPQQNILYDYLANGFISQARDLTTRMLSRYGYDNSGNRSWECYSGLANGDLDPSGVFQESTISYDELGRMSHIQDLAFEIDYEYDAVGNRRAVQATYIDPLTLGLRRADSLWYAYDQANRFTLTKGALIGKRGTSQTETAGRLDLGTDGVRLAYDASGRRLSAQEAGKALETYSYTADGFLEDTRIGGLLRARRRVDALGRTLQYKEFTGSGAWANTTTSTFNRDNRLLSKTTASSTGSASAASDGTTTYLYYTDTSDTLATASATGRGELAKTVFNPTKPGTSTTTSTTYHYWDSAKQATIKVQASSDKIDDWAPGLSSLSYDANGFLSSARDYQGKRTITWFNNASGQTLRRDEQRPLLTDGKEVQTTFQHFWYYAAGRTVGEVSTDPLDAAHRQSYAESLALSTRQGKVDPKENKRRKPVTSADFDQNYQPINATYPASTPDTYTARTGDTLPSIALALWGDSAMWFLLAQANNLSGSETLVSGQVLIVPNKVTNIHNNAETFRPYNPGEVIGHIDPTLPDPPKPSGGGCGGLGVVIMIVVAVAVTVYTAGAAAGWLGAASTATGATGAAAIGGAAMTGGTLVAGSTGFVLGTATATAMASAAIGAAVGSVASQLVGNAIGAVDGFSWKAVAQSALTAGVTAGVGSALQGAGIISRSGSLVSQTTGVSETLLKVGGAALTQGLSSAATQAVQGKWSWRAIAASTVGAAAGSAAGSAMSSALGSTAGESLAKFASGMASSIAGGWASSQVMATDPRYSTARMSSLFAAGLGNALGESLAAGSDRDPSSASYRNEMDRESDAYQPSFNYNYRNGGEIEDDIAGERAARVKLVAAGASEEAATKYASAFRELAADPTQPLEFGRGSASALSQKFAIRPNDPEQASVYGKVLKLDGKTSADAWLASKDVAFRQQLDAMGQSIDAIRVSDPAQAGVLAQQHRIGVMALLNREVYFDTGMPELLPNGWGRVTDTAGLAKANLTSEMLVNEDSGYFAALYRNETDGSYVYANRGTNEGKDWAHNFLQAVGESSTQYEQALNSARRIARSSIADDVTFTGHSLGGGLASAQSYATGIGGITFNAAGLNPTTVGALGAGRMASNPGLVKSYYVNGELLSTMQDSGPKVAGVTLATLGSPLAGVAAYATLSKVPQAAGTRIAMDAVTDPSYRGGIWQQGGAFTALSPSMALDLHGMSYVLNSVMRRVMPPRL